MIDTRNSRLNIIFTAWFLAVALIPLIVVVPFFYVMLKQQALASVQRQLAAIVEFKTSAIQSELFSRMDYLKKRAAEIQQSTSSSAIDLLERERGTAEFLNLTFMLTDHGGTSVYQSSVGMPPELPWLADADTASTHAHLESGQLHLAVYSASQDRWLVGVFPVSTLEDIVQGGKYNNASGVFRVSRAAVGPTADVVLLDQFGSPLTTSLVQGELDRTQPISAGIARWSLSSSAVLSQRTTLSGRDVLAYARRAAISGLPVTVLASIDTNEALTRLYDSERGLTLSLIFALVGALVVLYAFIRMTTRRIVSPIQRTIRDLQTSAQRIQESIASTEKTMITQRKVSDSLFTNYQDQLSDIKSVNKEITSIVSSLSDIRKQTLETTRNVQLIDQLAAKSQDEAQDARSSVSSMKRLSTSHEVLLATLVHYSAEVDAIAADVGRISVATNYLSLNAAIEANKSAEHGRGLSGLVSEVGRLTLVTREASMKINDLVSSIQTELARSKESSSKLRDEAEVSLSVLNKALERLTIMSRDARKIAASVRVIDVAVAKESSSTHGIAEHSSDLTEQARATVRDARKIETLADEQAMGIRASASVIRKVTGTISKLSELIGSRNNAASQEKK